MFGSRSGGWSFSMVQFLLMGGIVLGCAAVVSAQDATRVEEDWEFVISSPDPNSSSPQVLTVISPTADLTSLYGVFLVNHQTEPDYVLGGLQLQVWNGDVNRSERKFPDSSVLQTENEVIRWTHSMELVEGGLEFAVTNGSSTTWGSFGGEGYLKATVETSLQNLNGYSSTVSEANSGVVLATHRVGSLRLLATRRYTADGSLIEDPPPE